MNPNPDTRSADGMGDDDLPPHLGYGAADDTADFEPDPARSYERAKPYKEYGEDRLDCQDCPPSARPDRMIRTVRNAHESHQLNSESAVDAAAAQRIE